MSAQPEPPEYRAIEACEAARAQTKPNLSQIAREYGVSYNVLRGRVRQGKQARTTHKPINKALEGYQEEALTHWIRDMRDRYLPVTPALLEDMANLSLQRAGTERKVSKMWVYRFIKRLPQELHLAPMKQKTKEHKRIQAEDSGLLELWYSRWKTVVKDTAPRLVYNIDECGFQPERGETITAVECIAADGWQMDPLFIFKGSTFMEAWYHGSEVLPPHTLTAVSPNGCISDELAVEWLQHFHDATKDRTCRGERRILLFGGHGAHFTREFLQRCEDYNIICFAFEPHSTHLCQPLDSKPFLSYKQHFRRENNNSAFMAGEPVGKADFLRYIAAVRSRAFNPRLIRESFKNRGIWPPDGSSIIEKLANNQVELPEFSAPDLRAYGDRTPSPPPTALTSSSVENAPPKSIQTLDKNLKKLSKIQNLTRKQRWNLLRVFQHNKVIAEHVALSNDIISRMTAACAPLRRKYTMQHVKPLSHTRRLSVRVTNRSIAKRKAYEAAWDRKRLAKLHEKVCGKPPP